MSLLSARVDRPELLDGPLEATAELAQSFRDIGIANRLFGGTAAVRFGLYGMRASTILDVGCGAADIPETLAEEARQMARPLRITCLDSSQAVLDVARRRTGNNDALSFVRADGTVLPYENKQFDVAMCNLTLHHLSPAAAVSLLRELRRVAFKPLVTDLYRSVPTLVSAWLFSRVVSNNRLTRHDAPLSAMRSYTPAELHELALEAGWVTPRVTKRPFFRMVAIDASTA